MYAKMFMWCCATFGYVAKNVASSQGHYLKNGNVLPCMVFVLTVFNMWGAPATK